MGMRVPWSARDRPRILLAQLRLPAECKYHERHPDGASRIALVTNLNNSHNANPSADRHRAMESHLGGDPLPDAELGLARRVYRSRSANNIGSSLSRRRAGAAMRERSL